MRTFKDNQDRQWSLAINVDVVKRVKASLDVDLMAAVEGKLLERLSGDPILLCDIVYVVCKPQADAEGVSDEDFGRAMAGDAIDDATFAFLEELVDFFPSTRRAVLRRALVKLEKLEKMTIQAAIDALDSNSLERLLAAELEEHDLEKLIRERMAELRSSGGTSTCSPAPPASTPAP